MNKKLMILTTSLLIGGTLLGTTAFASQNDSSGYEAYKTALLNMRNVKSATDTIKVSTSDNGSAFMSADITVKMNKELKSVSSDINIKAGDVTKEKDVFRQNDQTVVKDSDSDVYTVVKLPEEHAKWQERKPDEKLTEKRIENLENIVDSLIGNRKSYFVLTENNDGTKNVNVKLSENQILPVVNAVAAVIVRDRESLAVNEGINKAKINLELPKLDKDIRISGVDVTAVINKDGILEGQKGVVTLSGKDSSGVEHTLALNIDMSISKINNTTPDTVNLDGKQVKTVTTGELKHNR